MRETETAAPRAMAEVVKAEASELEERTESKEKRRKMEKERQGSANRQ